MINVVTRLLYCFRIRVFFVLFFCITHTRFALTQPDTLKFFQPAPSFHKARFYPLITGVGLTYAGTLFVLNEYWYKAYPRSAFHFFNDNAEWLQIDKVGHAYTAYFESWWSMRLLQWAGVERSQAIGYAGIAATIFQLSIEVLDGFSAKWGASWGDFATNTAGVLLMMAQEKYWQEQRLLLKFSFAPVAYPENIVTRANQLFGRRYPERLLKDYNGQTYWLSANICSFLHKECNGVLSWLNVSIGYGAHGMLGGFENKWNEGDEVIDHSDIPRYRQYYLSLDVDLSRIKTKSHFLKTVLSMFNILKFPAPALEWNRMEGMKMHLVHY